MGWWDPAFIHPLVVKRPVILYDTPGVGDSSGGNERLPADSKSHQKGHPSTTRVWLLNAGSSNRDGR